MKPSIMIKYEVSQFGRISSVAHDTGILNKNGLHFKATHGMSKTKEYHTWCRMRKRCYDKTSQDYAAYGGRGIEICNEWRESFESFFSYVGKAPSKKHSIDRINNNGNYEPGNVRWATPVQQARNTRKNKLILYKGEYKTIKEWCEVLKLPTKRILSRRNRGWSPEVMFNPAKYSTRKVNPYKVVRG